jgi:hypothetical protein
MSKPQLLYYSLAALLCGSSIYLMDYLDFEIPSLVRSYIPDGLWASSFMACICWIWYDSVKSSLIWVISSLLVMISFEFFQLAGIIGGTPDAIDTLVYVAFSLPFIITLYKRKN